MHVIPVSENWCHHSGRVWLPQGRGKRLSVNSAGENRHWGKRLYVRTHHQDSFQELCELGSPVPQSFCICPALADACLKYSPHVQY